jgi:integrase
VVNDGITMKGHLRKRGEAWELRAYAGRDPVSGREVYRTRTYRGGKRDAEDALAKFVQEMAGGAHASRDTTVGDLVAQWFELAKADLSPSTVFGYQNYIRRYIEPTLGSVPLAKLRVAQLDQLYAQLRKGDGPTGRPLATATVRRVHAVLRRALQQGLKWGWIDSNPAALASPPRVRNKPVEAPEPTVVTPRIQKAGGDTPDLAAFLHVAATTGARRGELCGLRWDAVDLEGGTILISRSIVEGGDGKLVEKDTKTHSIRRIALDDTTVQVLVEHRERCRERARACGTDVGSAAYVFSRDVDSSRPMTPNDITHAFIVLRDGLGLHGVRLHDLRHFAATRLLAAGIPVRTVSGRLGHANAATTLGVYAHFLAESDREAANTLEEILRSSKAPFEGVENDHSGVHQSGVVE